MGERHEAKWRERGQNGVLSDTHLYDFHTAFIERGFHFGAVELLKFSAGDAPFAWLYNFIDNKRVLYYMGGFEPAPDNRHKPGLLAHALAIAAHLKDGMDAYDFMVGGDRYKYNLGTRGPDMASFAIQRRTPALMLENAARHFKNRFAPQSDDTL